MSKTHWLVGTALLALLSVAACSLVPPTASPSVTPSATAAGTPVVTPGPALSRDLAASPTPVDLEACAVRLSDSLANVQYEIGLDELHDMYKLVTYHVGSDILSQPEYGFAPAELQGYQGDTALHEQIWRLVANIFPDEERGRIRYFLIYTDGAGDSLASVQQVGSPYYWRMAVDIEDVGDGDVLSVSLVHELAHLVTLNESQVDPNEALFDDPGNEALYRRGQADCENYYSPAGCSKVNSYINRFFESFWTDIYEKWQEALTATSSRSYSAALERIYDAHPGSFVTHYSVYSPEEDIAESFLYFVLSPRPAGDTVAEQKMLFFYDFSALVGMRTHILEGLCTPADQP